MTVPTRSEIEGWRSDHLRTAAGNWEAQIRITEEVYGRAVASVDSAPWQGNSADQARDRMFADLVAVRGTLENLRQAVAVAMTGADALDAAKRSALDAIANAERQFFSVSQDLRVTDRLPPIFGVPLALLRRIQARHFEADIQAKAIQLADADQRIADQLSAISDAMRGFDLAGGAGGGGPTGDPTVTGPAGPLQYEGDAADLNVTLPGSDVTISGDGRTGYPTLNGNENPLDVGNPRDANGNPVLDANGNPVHDIRPLPTGTIVGPDGKQYAMYSEVPYDVDGKPNPNYATPDTTVVDLADPSKSIGVLPGISQASGAYDPKTNRMVIVGNTGPNDRTRQLWVSDPIDPANPNGWMDTLQNKGTIAGLPGDRESQLVALKGGGFMLVGSDNVTGPGSQPISSVTAATPEGLLTAQPTNLFPGSGTWPAGAPPYGPTVVDTVYDPVTGTETVELRVSTWERPPTWPGPTPEQPNMPYNPKTYTTNVTVQH